MKVDKRYQVFISSTFRDLIEERQAVLKAVLELDHMPAGMELFPASDESAWQLIKDVIDDSDYYILIVGGRYGSLDETGLGFTEKEYDYAHSTKKPVIAVLHENPDNLPRGKTESDELTWKKLQEFRNKVERSHTCVYWNNKEDLKAKVIVGLTSIIKRHPAIGWIPADQVPSGATIKDILTLRERIAELEKELEKNRLQPPPGTDDLHQGEDTFKMKVSFKAKEPSQYDSEGQGFSGAFEPSWNDIFAGVAPKMIAEASNSQLREAFSTRLSELAKESFKDASNMKRKVLYGFKFNDHDIDTCIIQLRALGLIHESEKKRSIHDKGAYWILTPYGDQKMVQLRALRKSSQAKAGILEL